MKSGEVISKLQISKDRFYKLVRSGAIPFDRKGPRTTYFNLSEVKAAMAGGAPTSRPVDDEDHPDFDEMDRGDEEKVTQCSAEAFEASQEAAVSVYLDYIHRARKSKNRSLVRRLVAALAKVQQEMSDEEE